MKVLLSSLNSKYIHQNLAIRLLYELNKSFEGLEVKEYANKEDLYQIAKDCSEYDIVAFSCYIWNINQTIQLAKIIKELHPASKILLGGPEVSYDWNEIIELTEIDYIIHGEGELPFASFLNYYPEVEKVPSLIWKKDGITVENKKAKVFDLQFFQHINPYASMQDEELKNKICYIEASRGCPNCCTFCLAGLENNLRYMPINSIQSNLLYLMQRGKVIKFLDRTFNAKPSFAIAIFEFILQHYQSGNIFQFEIKADVLQREFIDYVKAHVSKGIFRFEIGIQTLNDASNKEIKRKLHFENISTFIQEVSGNVEIHLDLIVGLPHDTFKDIKYSFEKTFSLHAPELQLGFLKFLKGTPIRKENAQHGYIFDPHPPYQIIESYYLSKSEIQHIVMLEEALEIYWNKKRALYSLKYISQHYSIFDFLSGLGRLRKESIHQVNSGLIENYTSLFEYSKQEFPNDEVLLELIALDYYLHHKVKPASKFIKEIEAFDRLEIIYRHHLDPQKYRYVMHKVHFSVSTLIKEGHYKLEEDIMLIKFDGIHWPSAIFIAR